MPNPARTAVDENLSSNDRLTLTYDIAQNEYSTGDPYAGSGTLPHAGGAKLFHDAVEFGVYAQRRQLR
jgi:hypothetical protein